MGGGQQEGAVRKPVGFRSPTGSLPAGKKRRGLVSPSPEKAAEDAGLLRLGRGGGYRRRRLAVGLRLVAVALRYGSRIGADATGAPVGLGLARETEVEVDAGQSLEGRGRVAFLDVGDEVAGGAEHHVVLEMRVAGKIECGHQLTIAGRADEDMNVRGTHAVALLCHDHLPD